MTKAIIQDVMNEIDFTQESDIIIFPEDNIYVYLDTTSEYRGLYDDPDEDELEVYTYYIYCNGFYLGCYVKEGDNLYGDIKEA